MWFRFLGEGRGWKVGMMVVEVKGETERMGKREELG